MDGYTFKEMIPPVDNYMALRNAVHWITASREACERALKHTLYAVCVWHDGHMIGQARVVGDDSVAFYIQDVIVHPDHQGKGIGKAILQMILAYIRSQASPGSFIGLMAAEHASGFYEQFGFSKRPETMPGMGMRIP
ncbi:MAG TPA: GNAT family N-acetyltransferase [Armatimonadota bacterium]|nr:GNAT family N-acetyltransferase [Armatimonadota bacterium]